MKIVYVIGPYYSGSFMQIEHNIRQAEAAAIELWNAGFGVFTPHLNTAHFEVKAKAPEDSYRLFDLLMMDACHIILTLPGWQQSSGSKSDLAHAVDRVMPIYYSTYDLIFHEKP